MFSILRKTVVFFAAFIGIASSNYSLAAEEPTDAVVVGVIAQKSDDPNAGIKVNAFYGINLEYLTNIAKVLNLKLVLRSYDNIPDILNDIESGKITEVFGCGTAAVIVPVGKFGYKDKEYLINNNEPGPVSAKLYQELTDIQYGRKEDPFGWTMTIEVN